jgi:hypothetical protein
MKRNYITFHKINRPVLWIVQDGLFTLIYHFIQLLETIVDLLTLSTVNIQISYSVLFYSVRRQMRRRNPKTILK